MATERFSVSLRLNLYPFMQGASSSSAYTPHPGERLGRILYPDFYIGKTLTCNPGENRPFLTEVLVWISGRLGPLTMSWHTSKPKSRHSPRPTAPPPTQSLCLGEVYLWAFKDGQSFHFPTTTAQKQVSLGEKLLRGFCSWPARSVKIDVHLSANEWQLNLFSVSSKKSSTSGVITLEVSLFFIYFVVTDTSRCSPEKMATW